MARPALTRSSLTIAIAIATSVLAACTASGGPGVASPTIDGHTYLSTGIEGASLVPGTQVRLSFSGGSLNANAGCNVMGGSYAIDGDRLRTDQLSMTEMGCDDARQHQDEWLARFLSAATLTLDGDTLTLTDGTIRLTLLDKEVATPDQPLEGTSWVLDGIISGDAVSSVPAAVTAAIQVAGGRVEVNAGCNTGGGQVEVSGGTITVGPIVLTKMACAPEAMTVEGAVITVLSGPVAFGIDADSLTLTAGDRGLTFRAANCAHCRPRTEPTLPTMAPS
jgi:heat shock protein HslJ